MLFLDFSKWDCSDSQVEGLLFFAQRILELSYDKSDFDEKGLLVDTKDIINEVVELIDLEISLGDEIGRNEYDILLDELKDRIRSDEVVKKIIGDKLDSYLSKLAFGEDKSQLKNALEVLNMKLSPSLYFDESRGLIKDLVLSGKNRDKLYQATTRLFEFLICYGYQKGTIYFLANRFFFDRDGGGASGGVNDIDAFFDLFDLKNKEFEVVFVASKLFSEIENSCKKFGLSVIEQREVRYNKKNRRWFLQKQQEKKGVYSLRKS